VEIVVIGGGIAGLAFALALHQRGIACRLVRQSIDQVEQQEGDDPPFLRRRSTRPAPQEQSLNTLSRRSATARPSSVHVPTAARRWNSRRAARSVMSAGIRSAGKAELKQVEIPVADTLYPVADTR
jgi:2-polyprenyl-6-methoxyphenol hydroxylase-like FAD-dependent oxidoreductase